MSVEDCKYLSKTGLKIGKVARKIIQIEKILFTSTIATRKEIHEKTGIPIVSCWEYLCVLEREFGPEMFHKEPRTMKDKTGRSHRTYVYWMGRK